jgi:hypothetical protein
MILRRVGTVVPSICLVAPHPYPLDALHPRDFLVDRQLSRTQAVVRVIIGVQIGNRILLWFGVHNEFFSEFDLLVGRPAVVALVSVFEVNIVFIGVRSLGLEGVAICV